MQKKTVKQRYLLSEAPDGEWYLIPLEHSEAWVAYMDSFSMHFDELEPAMTSSPRPQWARPLQGHPFSIITFENPSIVS